MNRRSFLQQSALLGAGLYLSSFEKLYAKESLNKSANYYQLFQNPSSHYRPFVRWWWNGNKVEKKEIARELRLLKEAGIGGVEINPISFPKRADDMGIPSLRWLSEEWIDHVQYACEEANKLDMTADLIVGSGWPFGSEDLREDERAHVILVFAEKVSGPTTFAVSRFHILHAVDPGVTDRNALRHPEILSLSLAKDPLNSLADTQDFSDQKNENTVQIEVPEGDHVFYAVVKYTSFAMVINGAPGASGSILNHMDKRAVQSYLDRMSNTMENRMGVLKNYIRALFTDSMELEGCNWTDDFSIEFKKRCGYDLEPYLPYLLFKVGRLGAVVDENYGASKTPAFREILNRVRFDFEFVKASLYKERFTDTYLAWCKKLGVKSRAQAYGRGFFPLETSLGYDIPEGESWTMNYLRHKLGEEMPDSDYRRGRGYTMINKYVSSAAHLTGKRIVSCEEMTNTYLVFNATLELLKLGSDQSIMSGITHSIWHGFNYSPIEAPFPGWIQYGSYYSEKNNWWPYFKLLNDYKARLSSQLQHADQYTDIAILPANYDLWSKHGVQTDPFPEKLNVPYTSLLWEAISKNGGSADYITELILLDATISKGKICYGKQAYSVLFLPGVESMSIEAFNKVYDFVGQGGRVYCIDTYPYKSVGFQQMELRDQELQAKVAQLKISSQNFKLLAVPQELKFLEWYIDLQQSENLPHYVKIDNPNRFFMQVRYIRDDGSEFYFLQNANRSIDFHTTIQFLAPTLKDKQAWIWDMETGLRWKLTLNKEKKFTYNFGPTESLLIVFDKEKNGNPFKPLLSAGAHSISLNGPWELELVHAQNASVQKSSLDNLIDFKDVESLMNFSGTIRYTNTFNCTKHGNFTLNLGKVFGISEVYINRKLVGTKWYGRRLFDVSDFIQMGANTIEIKVVTTMGNYLKTLKDNESAQYWVNRPGREQEIQSMGLVGPVEIYEA